MQQIEIHIVFYSELDIKVHGLYQTIQHDSYVPMALCYAVDYEEVKIVDLTETGRLPGVVVRAVLNPKVIKYAHNAEATWLQLTKILKSSFEYENWRDISKFLKYIGITDEETAMSNYELFFCSSRKVGKVLIRNTPAMFSEKWKQYKVNMKHYIDIIRECLKEYAPYMKESIWMQQKYMVQIHKIKLEMDMESLVIANRKEHMELASALRRICRILNLRSEEDYRKILSIINKTISKEEEEGVLKQYAGAMGLNLAKIKYFRNRLNSKNAMRFSDLIDKCKYGGRLQGYDCSLEMISFLLNDAAFISKGNRYYLCTYHNMEAEIVAWLGDSKLPEPEKTNMDNVLWSDIYKACLYGGGKTYLQTIRMDKGHKGEISWNQMVMGWRASNKEIVSLWGMMFRACCYCLLFRTSVEIGKIRLSYENNRLKIELPSGRNIFLMNCRIDKEEQNQYRVWYKRDKKQEEQYLDGGKLCRIITYYIQQDIIENLLALFMENGFHVVAAGRNYIAINEIPNVLVEGELHKILQIMPTWCNGLYLIEKVQCMGRERNDKETL